ncbi:MAG: lysylphosphatidylglycerol synthase transmembrane domain-containing protein [Acidimicrobiales bacterium]
MRRVSTEDLDQIRSHPDGTAQIGAWIKQGLFLALGMFAIYLFAPQLLAVVASAPELKSIRPRWIVAMVLLEVASFCCIWLVMKILMPRVSWFVAATSQLVSNAVSRVVPGAAASGGAAMFRMLSVSGVSASEAGGALAVMSILSTIALFTIPAIGILLALLGAPVPEAMWPVAAAGGVMFVLLLVLGTLAMVTDRPLQALGVGIDRVLRRLHGRFGIAESMGHDRLVQERDRLVSVVGSRWRQLLVVVASNWIFDYLALVAALYGVGANPRLSLVLLAYACAALAGMIPITPGGIGFVEATLYSLLVISGISGQRAVLAIAAYRLVSLLLPIIAGLPAWALYRRRFRPSTADLTPAFPVTQQENH